MIVTGKVLYAHTAGRVNYHRLGHIQPEVMFDHLVNGQPTGDKCYFTGRVVWEGDHAGQVAILPNSTSFKSSCAAQCRDVYYADVDWQTGTFKCMMPDSLAYCCTQSEGDTAGMQLAGNVWTPRCVAEGHFSCPGSSTLETLASVKTDDGGWLTVIRRVPATGVHEFVLINQDCRILDTFISSEQALGWSPVTERYTMPIAGTIVPLPGYVRDDLLYVCWHRNSGQFHCWMSLEYPYAPPDEQWAERCYERIQSRYYVLKMTPSGFDKTVHEHQSGPLGACSICDNMNGIPGNYTALHAIPYPPGHIASGSGPGPLGTGRSMVSLMCWDPAKVLGYKGGFKYVETPLGEVGCGDCETDTAGKEFRTIDGVQFVRSGSHWHRYEGCFWKQWVPLPPPDAPGRWDYWYNHTSMKYPTAYGEPLATAGVGSDLITTGGYKLSLTDGSVIKEISSNEFSCCVFENAEGNFVGQDKRDGFPYKPALFNGDLDYVGPCCEASDETIYTPMNLDAGTTPPAQNGGSLAYSLGGDWRFCSAVPFVDHLDQCPEYLRVTACQVEDLSATCGQENVYKVRARFTVKTTPGDVPVAGAAVTGKIVDTQTALTDGNGTVAFETGCFAGSGTVTFTVDAIEKEGFGYLPSRNTCSDAQWKGPVDCTELPEPDPAAFGAGSPFQLFRSTTGKWYHVMEAVLASHGSADEVEYQFICVGNSSLNSGWRNTQTVAGTFPNGQVQVPPQYWAEVSGSGLGYHWVVHTRALGCDEGGTPSASKQVQ